MSEKRKDHKGRVLRTGESQRADGMYMYRYNDAGGVRRTIYSWRLVETDKNPPRKNACEPLRSLEKQLKKDLDDGIQTFVVSKITLNELFEKYMDLKIDLKPTSRSLYFALYEKHIKDKLGKQEITSIKYSDIKKFYLLLCNETGLKPNSIHLINAILNSVFSFAVRDGYIKSNPVSQVYAELKKQNSWDQEKQHALTISEQIAFMDFIKHSSVYRKWYNIFTVFLGTGCRIGELTGLRWDDCDFTENVISINHSLVYCKTEDGKTRKFSISTPKTKSGERTIPMLSDVRNALLKEHELQNYFGFNQSVIDGYSGFIFKNRQGEVFNPQDINRAIIRIVEAYNTMEARRAKAEARDPIFLPRFTAHNLRHTFCTRLCENETNLKVIQEIMGHANISTTMDIYNEATQEQKKASFSNLEGKIMPTPSD